MTKTPLRWENLDAHCNLELESTLHGFLDPLTLLQCSAGLPLNPRLDIRDGPRFYGGVRMDLSLLEIQAYIFCVGHKGEHGLAQSSTN